LFNNNISLKVFNLDIANKELFDANFEENIMIY